MNGSEAAWAAIVGMLVPLFVALLKQATWDDVPVWTNGPTWNELIAAAVCAGAGFGTAYFQDSLHWTNADEVVVTVSIVLVSAFTWYKMLWKPVGVDGVITRRTSR